MGACLVLTALPVRAQESRAAILADAQAAKAQAATPPEASFLEKLIGYIDRNDLLDRFADGDGFYPFVGGITSGGGLAFGGGYRRHFFDYGAEIQASAAMSSKDYRELALQFRHPRLWNDRLEVSGDVTYRFFPEERFYGLGRDSLLADRVSFGLEGIDAAFGAAWHPRPWLTGGTRLGLLDTQILGGADPSFPSIEAPFADSQAPGLGAQPDARYAELYADVDTRDAPGNPRSGTHHRVSWVRYNDSIGIFSFNRLTAEGNQFIPVFDKKRVFLLRARLTLSDPDAGHRVPFFLMPTLGGSHTLRSYTDYRFRDNHALVMNAEYRWEAFSNLDMALFADAGTVAHTRRDLALRHLRSAYGLGFRFNTASDVFARLDVAHGADGFRVLFKFSGPFRDRGNWPEETRSHRHRRIPG